jgi:hypothetical protein
MRKLAASAAALTVLGLGVGAGSALAAKHAPSRPSVDRVSRDTHSPGRDSTSRDTSLSRDRSGDRVRDV